MWHLCVEWAHGQAVADDSLLVWGDALQNPMLSEQLLMPKCSSFVQYLLYLIPLGTRRGSTKGGFQ